MAPSDHLRHVWPGAISRRVRTDFQGGGFLDDGVEARDLKVQLAGRDAEALLELIAGDARYRSAVSFDSVQAYLSDGELGWINEGINRMGRFAVSGDSVEFHLLGGSLDVGPRRGGGFRVHAQLPVTGVSA